MPKDLTRVDHLVLKSIKMGSWGTVFCVASVRPCCLHSKVGFNSNLETWCNLNPDSLCQIVVSPAIGGAKITNQGVGGIVVLKKQPSQILSFPARPCLFGRPVPCFDVAPRQQEEFCEPTGVTCPVTCSSDERICYTQDGKWKGVWFLFGMTGIGYKPCCPHLAPFFRFVFWLLLHQMRSELVVSMSMQLWTFEPFLSDFMRW